MSKRLSTRKKMCETCPFRPGSPYSDLADHLAKRSMKEGRICHSTGDSVIVGFTGKKELLCRGSRDLQLKMFAGMGFIEAATDEAWDKKCKEMGL
jgi:hypothetical protein